MKHWTILGVISLMIFAGGCANTLQVSVEPPIGKMGISKPLPLKGALYISSGTRNYRYKSPEYIPSSPMFNFESIRPFELPVGEAFARAADQTFSQLFQEIQVINNYSRDDPIPLIIEARIEEFRLTLEYATFGYRPRGSGLLDVQGIIKARLRLIRPGKSPWEKVYAVQIPPDRVAVNPWTEEAVGKRVGEAIASLFEGIALELGNEPEMPREPLQRWLTQ